MEVVIRSARKLVTKQYVVVVKDSNWFMRKRAKSVNQVFYLKIFSLITSVGNARRASGEVGKDNESCKGHV